MKRQENLLLSEAQGSIAAELRNIWRQCTVPVHWRAGGFWLHSTQHTIQHVGVDFYSSSQMNTAAAFTSFHVMFSLSVHTREGPKRNGQT